jgi:diguanylate cyclase (GGDEF)-like protein/PAS domain S-box-containing protein/putative nucleotidyltransferase with HDIG domain
VDGNELLLSDGGSLNATELDLMPQRAAKKGSRTAEAALRESERRLQSALDSGNMGIWELDLQPQVMRWSARTTGLFGLEPEEREFPIGDFLMRVYPDDREDMLQAIDNTIVRGTTYEHTFRVVWPDGTVRWLQSNASALYDDQGQPMRLMGTVMDITERKHEEEQVRLLSTVAAESLNAIVIMDAQERILYVNPGFERDSGYTLEELRGHRPGDVLHGPDTDIQTSKKVRSALDAREPVSVELLNYHKNGTPYWQEIHITPVLDNKGAVTHFVGIVNNVTARKQAAKEQQESDARLRVSEERYALATEGSQNGIWDWDIRTGETHFSARMKQMMGYAESEFPNRVETWISHIHPDDVPRVDAARAAYFKRETDAFEVEFRIRHKDASYHWVLGRGVARFDSEGKPYRMAGSHMDITEHKRLTEESKTANEWQKDAIERLTLQQAELREANTLLESLATTDGLTGLKNHRSLQERLREEYDRARRYNTPLSIMMLDVDKFKEYNDGFGHPAGDAVLRQLARILQETARTSDVVARYGGEEFAILLPGANVEQAKNVAERYRYAVETAVWPVRAVTASVGAATLVPATTYPDALLVEADVALYRSKHRGRNCVTHASDPVEIETLDTEAARWYDDLLHKVLTAQAETLGSASEQVRETLSDAYDATILSWSRILNLKDKETEGHSQRVTDLTVRLARSLNMNEQEVQIARWGALLHDIGKMAVPDRILHKPGPLTEDEWVIMRQHTTIARDMIEPIQFLGSATDIPYCHHEKWDGTGYPRGLQGDEIPLMARLFAVIDVYDALTRDRPYRVAWPEEKVQEYLRAQAGIHFDPRAVDAFLTMLETDCAERKAA